MTRLPEPPEPVWIFRPGAVTQANLTQLHTKVDQFFGRILDKYSDQMQCRRGCSGCCHQSLSLVGVEMAQVIDAVMRLAPDLKARLRERVIDMQANAAAEATPPANSSKNEPCPLLEDDLCVIYDNRPTICRSHGVVVLAKNDDGNTFRDVCPLNFGGFRNVDSTLATVAESLRRLPDTDVLDLERLNQILGVIQYLAAQSGEVPAERLSVRAVLLEYLR